MLNYDGHLRPVLKVLTDYPRDDLAHDEVHQALVTACAKHKVNTLNVDVGSVPGMDTVTAGVKTAQLALNSSMGFGHVFHTNCAPRTNMVSAKSAGEKVVLGMTTTGITVLLVNSGYTIAPFHDLVESGEMMFYQTSIRDSGSQFRSRDFFPDALAELAAHLSSQFEKMGADKIETALKDKKFEDILSGLSYLGEKMEINTLPHWPAGVVLYTDNFGNIKINFKHEDLLAHYQPGEVVALRLGNKVCDAVIGSAGFSQGEGMLALTSGSSGWSVAGKKTFFTEIFMRGAPASRNFGEFQAGDRVLMLREDNLKSVFDILRRADHALAEKLRLHNITEAKVISMLSRVGLIQNGYDSTELQKSLEKGDLLKRLDA